MTDTVTVPLELVDALNTIAPACEIRVHHHPRCPHDTEHITSCTDPADWIVTLACACPTDQLLAVCTPHKVLLPRFIARVDGMCTGCFTQPQIAATDPLR